MTASRPELLGTLGAVSSTHWLASTAGMAVLHRGGNAFDAAVAAGFVLQVVEPHSNSLGGDVSIVLYSGTQRRGAVICGQGPMPRGATIEHFRRLGLRQIPGSGLLPACVPGAFGAWLRLLAEFGTMRLRDVLVAAIGYAETGYPLLPDTARAISVLAPLFATEWPESGRTYLVNGAPIAAGTLVRNRVLAATLARLLAEAERSSGDREAQIETAYRTFYDGFVAEMIDRFVRCTDVLDSTGERHHGLLTGDDLSGWRPQVEAPVTVDFGSYTVLKPGVWSQGPVFLQQLALLDGVDLSGMHPDASAYIHTFTEAAKLALADREAWYGDPAHVSVPMGALLSPAYSAKRRALIGERAAAVVDAGSPQGVCSWIPRFEADPQPFPTEEWMRQLRSGMPTIVLAATAKAADTCTVAVADRTGNLVAAVPSGGWLKSSPAIPGLGFPLGTRGQTLWLVDGHPNSLAPAKRPRTTLSPTVVLREGTPYLAFGTPGGDRQDQWTLQTFLAATEFGLDLQSATEVTTFHTDHFPSSFVPHACRPGVLVLENSCGAATADDLRRRGHTLDLIPARSLGAKVCAVGYDAERGLLRAAAGPRGRQAYAVCG